MTTTRVVTRRPVPPVGRRAVALITTARGAARGVLTYRLDFWSGVAGLCVRVLLLMIVWRTLYAGRDTMSGIGVTTAVNYAVLAAIFQTLLLPWAFSGLPDRIRHGQIGIDISRPVGLVPQVLAQNVGTMAARSPAVVIALVVAILVGAVTLPPHGATLALFLVSSVLGLALAVVLNLAVSMVAFWTLQITGPMMVYRFGSAFLSGALVPLWFMPNWLAGILTWLPFQAQMFTPLQIYFGTLDAASAAQAIVVQLVWLLIMAAVVALVWRRARRRVVVQGG